MDSADVDLRLCPRLDDRPGPQPAAGHVEGGRLRRDSASGTRRGGRTLAVTLAQMEPPRFPMALGVLFCSPAPSYDSLVAGQIAEASKRGPAPDLNALLRRGTTWRVGA